MAKSKWKKAGKLAWVRETPNYMGVFKVKVNKVRKSGRRPAYYSVDVYHAPTITKSTVARNKSLRMARKNSLSWMRQTDW